MPRLPPPPFPPLLPDSAISFVSFPFFLSATKRGKNGFNATFPSPLVNERCVDLFFFFTDGYIEREEE